MTEEELKDDWSKRGFSFGQGTIKLGDGVEEASHGDREELVVLRIGAGRLKFTVGDKSFIVEDDREVLIPAKVVHSIKNIGTEAAPICFGYRAVDTSELNY
ncbi:MAG: cupin domain-containing protein [Planctomycetota bacterium]|nr:cupin domain-containing protein [Planctomycetota bacterium]